MLIPAGTCIWTSQVNVSKGITLKGAGEGVTTIIDNITKDGSPGSVALIVTVDAPNNFRLTGLTFKGQAYDPNVWNKGHINIGGTMTAFRVDHITVQATTSFIITKGCVYGLIDHITISGYYLLRTEHLTCGNTNYGDGSWAMPIDWGGPGAVYVEDSTLTGSAPPYLTGFFDSFSGGRLVIRHNRFYQGNIGTHGTDTGQRYRSQRVVEIYDNVFEYVPEQAVDFVAWIRGGTGVFFNNTIKGPGALNFLVRLVNCRDAGAGCAGMSSFPPWGACDGTSQYDTNLTGQGGYRCVDQPGSGTSKNLGGSDAPPPGPVGNALDPVYLWNNTSTFTPRLGDAAGSQHVQAGRDYHIGTPRPGYTPYVYPHPLQNSGGTASVSSGDTVAPVPGNSGTISAGVSSTTATLNWTKATDNVTSQSGLQYEVRLSTGNDLLSVADAEAYGAIAAPYTADINSVTIPGWNPGTTYYFNVIVKDSSGNKAIYVAKSVTTASPDISGPVPGNGGLILASAGANTVALSWNKASDNISLQSSLQYEVRQSGSGNIDMVSDAEGNGVIVKPYTADINTFLVTGLNPGNTYYFNVIVKDGAGNKTTYAMRSITTPTLGDTSAPVPGNSGQITALTTTNSITVGWAKATDAISLQSAIQYEVRRSSSPNIDTIANVEANGVVVKAFTADISAFVVTGLTPGTTYYFNVVARDESGNKSAYTMRSAATVSPVDTAAPTPGGSGQITANPNSNGVTLTWAKATDDVTAQSSLKYEIRMSSSGNLDTVATAEANGSIAKAYTTDLSTFTVNGLNSGTMYYFNVIVMDAASNKATYVMRSATTTGRKPTLTQNNNGKKKGVDATTAVLTAADTQAPMPGASGLITVSGVGPSGLTLVWTMGTDNVTPQAGLQYKVLRSSSENMNTVADAESNGTVLLAYTANLNSYVVKNLVNASNYYFTVIVKDDAGNKALYATAGDLTIRYSFVPEGQDSFSTTAASGSLLTMNHARISPAADTALPAGVAIVRFAPNGKLVSEGGFALTAASRSGTAYVQVSPASDKSDRVSTGIAFSNSSGQSAEISYSLVDVSGAEVKTGVLALPANQQVSAFLDESPFFAPTSFTGTFRYVSTVPVTASGMRGITKSSGEFLFSSLPVSSEPPSTGKAVLPLFGDGGGWSTEIVLMNRSMAAQNGTVQFFGLGSTTEAPLLEMRVNGETHSTFTYSIPPQSLVRLVTEGQGTQMANGSVRITPNGSDTSVPDVIGILALRRDGRTVTESSISGVSGGTAFRAYVEASGGSQWVNSSFVLVNTANTQNVVSFQFMTLDGMPVGSVSSVTLPAGGHISKFVREISPTLPEQFRGLVRITSSASLGVSVFRCTYNAQGDFLYTPTPAVNEAVAAANSNLAFPMVATGAGYNTQLILFGAAGQAGAGDLLFISNNGVPRTGSSLGVAP